MAKNNTLSGLVNSFGEGFNTPISSYTKDLPPLLRAVTLPVEGLQAGGQLAGKALSGLRTGLSSIGQGLGEAGASAMDYALGINQPTIPTGAGGGGGGSWGGESVSSPTVVPEQTVAQSSPSSGAIGFSSPAPAPTPPQQMATLVNLATGEKVVVPVGSPEAQAYFGQGYQLMTKDIENALAQAALASTPETTPIGVEGEVAVTESGTEEDLNRYQTLDELIAKFANPYQGPTSDALAIASDQALGAQIAALTEQAERDQAFAEQQQKYETGIMRALGANVSGTAGNVDSTQYAGLQAAQNQYNEEAAQRLDQLNAALSQARTEAEREKITNAIDIEKQRAASVDNQFANAIDALGTLGTIDFQEGSLANAAIKNQIDALTSQSDKAQKLIETYGSALGGLPVESQLQILTDLGYDVDLSNYTINELDKRKKTMIEGTKYQQPGAWDPISGQFVPHPEWGQWLIEPDGSVSAAKADSWANVDGMIAQIVQRYKTEPEYAAMVDANGGLQNIYQTAAVNWALENEKDPTSEGAIVDYLNKRYGTAPPSGLEKGLTWIGETTAPLGEFLSDLIGRDAPLYPNQ